MTKRMLTRREFVTISAVATAGALAAACKATPTAVPATEVVEEPEPTAKPAEPTAKPAEPTATPEPVAPVSKYKEAPMLAALVDAGTLPPVDERLPLNPWVCPVAESIGQYGGNIRRGFKGVSDKWGPTKHIDRNFVYFDQNLMLQPRFLESWDVSEDGKIFTLHLRKGVKWSDGQEFTSASFQWYFDNVAKNADLSKTPPSKLATAGTDKVAVLCEMEIPDDYTVIYKFAHPNPLWPYQTFRETQVFFQPGHYMEQWHMGLTDDTAGLEAKVAEAGFESWATYYNDDRAWWYLNPERPVTYPWFAKNSMAEELFTMERNPYFFGVDAEGNQLPYLDTVTHRLFETTEVFNLWIVNGEIDFQYRHVSISNYTLFKEAEEAGDYQVLLGSNAGHLAFQLNLATKEERLNKFFNTRDVRIAMSLAMNRDEVNELLYNGLSTPRQYSPLKSSPNYYEKLSNAYIEYDPDRANAMLDAAGYPRGADGYRVFPDGTTISFTIEGTDEPGSVGEDEALLIVQYLDDVGIKAAYKYFERALYTEHYTNNEIEAAKWGGDRTVIPLAPAAIIFRGVQPDRPWAAGFGQWLNSGGTQPGCVEPPADHFIWKIWNIWDQISVEPDPAQQNKLFEQILDIWAEEIPMIGLLGETPSPIIVKNGFHNYLPGMPLDDTTGDEHLLNTETYFWDEPEKHMG